jgi:hypothetical protein
VVRADRGRHPIIELLEAAFSVQSVLTLYNVDHLPLRDSYEAAVRRVGGWCEMAGNVLRWKTLPSSAVKTVTEST